jgi:hypothetical protein
MKAGVTSALMIILLTMALPSLVSCRREEKAPSKQQTEELRQKALKRGLSFSLEI